MCFEHDFYNDNDNEDNNNNNNKNNKMYFRRFVGTECQIRPALWLLWICCPLITAYVTVSHMTAEVLAFLLWDQTATFKHSVTLDRKYISTQFQRHFSRPMVLSSQNRPTFSRKKRLAIFNKGLANAKRPCDCRVLCLRLKTHPISDMTSFSCRNQGRDSVCPML